MSTLQKIHEQLLAKLDRQTMAVAITTQQVNDIEVLVAKEASLKK